MFCKTDEDCKAGESCATFMGMPIGCIPTDGKYPVPPKQGKLPTSFVHFVVHQVYNGFWFKLLILKLLIIILF